MEKTFSPEYVILLHGLGRTRFSMSRIAERLESQGLKVLNVGYPSTRKNFDALIHEYLAPVVSDCEKRNASKIHVVTHSLGGILIRAYLQDHRLPKGSRIVMLSPPNQGSEVVDYLKKFVWFTWIMGPTAVKLGTHPESLPKHLKEIPYEIGIITGNVISDPWFSALIPGVHDGKVSVENAKLKEMTDFLVVPCGHTFIMRSGKTINQIHYFLQFGHFQK